ncbi:pectinesterase family protein [Paenibacillus aurantius]|uniref:Pectinesterase n=1 Tax=Paenibacillus aurantius TaxID=2918900 RepID=A0AA96RCY9_9BACL|nr:pectinesterase family protein [Paenibacillus aurantius]WNQ08936.1 pectinesterase family protein [Paenibacillus aurantius]
MKVIWVDHKGRGDYRTVTEAVAAVPDHSGERTVIRIRDGEYFEKIRIPASKTNLSLIGESQEGTVLVYDDSVSKRHPDGSKMTVYESASTSVLAADFYAEKLTFANSASRGERRGQAPALQVEGDRAVFHQVSICGHQDTLYTPGAGRQFYENCYIEGTVDFIFGSATAYFTFCELHSITRHNGYVTAASTGEDQEFGYVMANCRLTSSAPKATVALGRPWRPYGSVYFINTWMDEHIRPEGWDNWRDPEREKTARYAEYGSSGPGASPSTRVGWAKTLDAEEAARLTAERVLGGKDGWQPEKVRGQAGITA